MQYNFKTNRLLLNALTLNDVAFIFELVNSLEWIKFIGDKNIRTKEDAVAYVQKIISNPNVCYWTVKLQNEKTPIGIITFIKRDYLKHHDIGFAFLSNYTKQGYAYEATTAVLNQVTTHAVHKHILAVLPLNKSKTLRGIKPFHDAFFHENAFQKIWLLGNPP